MLPTLLPTQLSFNVQLHECDNTKVQKNEPRNLEAESPNLDTIMLAPPSILLHSTSLDHEDENSKGKIQFVFMYYYKSLECIGLQVSKCILILG